MATAMNNTIYSPTNKSDWPIKGGDMIQAYSWTYCAWEQDYMLTPQGEPWIFNPAEDYLLTNYYTYKKVKTKEELDIQNSRFVKCLDE